MPLRRPTLFTLERFLGVLGWHVAQGLIWVGKSRNLGKGVFNLDKVKVIYCEILQYSIFSVGLLPMPLVSSSIIIEYTKSSFPSVVITLSWIVKIGR